MLPLLSFTFLSPLNHFLKAAGCEPKFVMLLSGKTGSRKSTLAALMLSFFGKFTASELPLSFRDTANSILLNTFSLKDVLTVIDDLHPSSRMEEPKMNGTAQAIMRAYGDRTGKGRLRTDSTPMESRPPQGNAIITAEFAPDIGESGTARYFALELKEKDVMKNKKLSIRMGYNAIAYTLNDMHIPARKGQWSQVKAVQAKYTHASVHTQRELKNPFAGILFCEKCGAIMKRYLPHLKESPIAWYRCQTRGCDCKMVKCEIVEDYVRDAMEEWLQNYILQIEADHQPKADPITATLEAVRGQLTQHILESYPILSPAEKNSLWKLVMKKATVYRSQDDKLTVNIYPNLPK